MANVIEKNNYVQWTSGTGQVIAEVIKVEGDILEVRLPSGVTASVGSDTVVQISAEDYNKAVSTLIEQLSANIKYQSKDAIAMSQELETLKTELNTVKASLEAALTEKTKLATDLEAANKALSDVKTAQIAQARFDELKTLNSEIVAQDKLGNMSQDQYDLLKNFAKASFDKVSQLQKEVDSVKNTSAKPDESVANAKPDETASDVTAAAAAISNTNSEQDLTAALTTFSRGLMVKTKKKSV